MAKGGLGVALIDRLGEALDGGQGGGIILSTLDSLVDWARGKSLWAMPMGTACCAMELIAASFNKFDFDRHGTFPRPDPRHTDVMVVAGTITKKMAPAVKRLHEQMADPKWVIAMGNCAVSGGIFYYDTYSVVRGIDEFLPVDVYIGGCPPRPESLQDAVLRLRERIATESIAPDRKREVALLLPESSGISFGARLGTPSSADVTDSEGDER
ncbi:MAG: NADH-quinone oxidoreductase subunit B family protein [Coriobacteriia bacterium]|jgi:NADH-quinone oxidoreductase subunit B|nr:NADH-quinone oxidoreductase subunit B family protein [Coriobacteriia bacterium]